MPDVATTISTEAKFRRRQKVAAAVDLPGVPAGTFGKVWFVSGVTWIRYHVMFDNGVEIANVDGAQLADRKAFVADEQVRREAELAAERESERAAVRAEALANLADGSHRH